MMTPLKQIITGVFKKINPDLNYRMAEQYHFNQLKRRRPELLWKALSPGPIARLDAGGMRIGHELFIFGGARLGGKAIAAVDIFELQKERWLKSIPMPVDMAHTHHGVVSDGIRYIYLISGQYGNYCSPPTERCFVFDALQRTWDYFISLPKARYAPTAQIWNGRLHVLAGSQEDRTTPAVEHWSIAVKDGQARESDWRQERPVPRGGPHRASAVIDGKLFIFGGQEGDYVAIPGDPEFTCTGELTCDLVYPDTYMLEHPDKAWRKMADMPVASSHTENTVISNGHCIALVGGQHYKDPVTAVVTLTDVIQVYDASKDLWKVAGQLPYGIKETIAAFYKGCLYFTTGQREKGPGDLTAGGFEKGMWKAHLDPAVFWEVPAV